MSSVIAYSCLEPSARLTRISSAGVDLLTGGLIQR
jgi:hypothetical protein